MRTKLYKILKIKMGILLIALIALMLFLQTSYVKKSLSKKLIGQLEEITHSKITYSHSEGILPFSFDLYQIQFQFKDQTWLKMDRLGLNRSLIYFVFWKKKRLHLDIQKATLYDIPNFNPEEKITAFKWPKLKFPNLFVQIQCTDINIEESVFNQKIPQDLNIKFNFSASKYGQVFNLKTEAHSKELKHVYSKINVKGRQKNQHIHASLHLSDPKNELGPFYFSKDFPSFETNIHLTGSPNAVIAFFNPQVQTKDTFRGTFSISAYPTVKDNDIISCLLHKKNLNIFSEMTFENDSGIVFEHVDVKGAEILFNGQLALSRDYQFHHSYLEGEVTCLKFTQEWFEEPLKGKLRAYTHFLGPYNNPKIVGEIASDFITYDKHTAYHVLSTLEYENREGLHTGEFTLKANVNQSPLEISTKYDFQNINDFNLMDILANYGGNKVSTPLLKKRKEIYQSTLEFNLEHLELFSPFFKREIHGDLLGKAILDIDVSPQGTLQLIDTQFSGSFFQIPKVNISDFKVTLNGSFPWHEYKKFQGEVWLKSDSFQYSQYYWKTIDGYFDLKRDSILYKVQANGNLSILSSGEFYPQEDDFKIDIRELSGHIFHHRYYLTKEATLDFSSKELSFSPISLRIGSGFLKLSENKSKSNLTLDLASFPIETISYFYPKMDLQGNIHLKADLNNLFNKTYGSLTAQFNRLKLQDASHKDIYAGEIRLESNKHELKGELTLRENKNSLGHFTFDIPLSFSLYKPSYHLSYDKTAHIDIQYKGWINPFIQLLIPHNHLIEGFANVDLKVKGPLKQPQIYGFANFHRGYYENLFLGLLLEDVDIEADAKGKYLKLKKFEAFDDERGSVSASGKVELSLSKKMPFEIALHLNHGKIIQFDFLSATFFGDVKLKGNLKKSYLSGDLQITTAEVEIPRRVGKGLPKLEVSYLYPRDEKPCYRLEKKERLFPIEFDLNVDVLNDAVIKGRGLNSSWAGKVHISGTDRKPKFKGKLNSQEGTFEFAGRYFQLREGSIHFNGHLGKDTSINLHAEHEISGYLISANLKGPLLKPYLTFKSEPAQSEREIISLVLFGQKVDSLNAFQGVSLTYTLASLSGIYEGPDVIDRIRKGIGLDQLSLGSLMSGDKDYTTIQVGKYITRGILITLSRPISADPAPFVITAYFRGGFQFQTFFDQQQISMLQLQWRLSY